MYHEGITVEKDDLKTFEWFQRSANQGDADAQHHIGMMYHEGIGVEQDYKKAMQWYQKAADQGNQEASNRIGKLVMNGKIDDKRIVIYSTQETGLTLGDLEDGLNN